MAKKRDKNPEKPLRAVLYARISRDKEGEELGVNRQLRLSREQAVKRGYVVVNEYKDNDIGASERTGKPINNKERPGYDEMLADAAKGQFEVIVSYSITRLTRRVREFEALVDLNKDFGIGFSMVDTNNELDLSSGPGLFIARMMANVATFESDTISQRQKATFQDNALAGKPKVMRQRAFGWKKDGLSLEPTEANLIQEAVQKILEGTALATIRDDWNSRGVLTAAGKPWEHTGLKRVLTSWRTAGVQTRYREPLYDGDGELVMGTWTPIIDMATREQALRMLAKRVKRKVRQNQWLLSGDKLRCAVCGGKMYGQLAQTATYVCKPGSGHNAITASNVDEYVLGALASRIITRDGEQDSEPEEPKVWPGEEQLEIIARKFNENAEDYNRDLLPRDVYLSQMVKLNDERQRLARERDRFYAEEAKPVRTTQSTKDAREWALDFLTHQTPGHEVLGDSDGSLPWSSAEPPTKSELRALQKHQQPDHTESAEAAASVEEGLEPVDADELYTEERALAIASEIKHVFISKGQRGRDGWGRKAFLDRIEIVWLEDDDKPMPELSEEEEAELDDWFEKQEMPPKQESKPATSKPNTHTPDDEVGFWF